MAGPEIDRQAAREVLLERRTVELSCDSEDFARREMGGGAKKVRAKLKY